MSQRITKVKKKTAGGFTEAIPIGAKAQNITLRDGTVLQDIVQELQTGRAGHADLTQAEYDALSPAQKNDGTVYFVSDGTVAGRVDAVAVHYNDTTGTLNSNYVQGAIDTLATNKVNYTDIINNLTSTNPNAVLSAAQGKILQDQITTLDGNVTSLLPLLGKQSNMLSNVDLNTLQEAGVYQIGNPALITNMPSENYGFLRVTHARSYIYQEYYELSSPHAVYQRRSTDNGVSFGAWVKRPTRTEVDTLISNYSGLVKRITYTYSYSDLAAGEYLNVTGEDFGYSSVSGYTPLALYNINTGHPSVLIRWTNTIPSSTSTMMSMKNTGTSVASGTASVGIVYIRGECMG